MLSPGTDTCFPWHRLIWSWYFAKWSRIIGVNHRGSNKSIYFTEKRSLKLAHVDGTMRENHIPKLYRQLIKNRECLKECGRHFSFYSCWQTDKYLTEYGFRASAQMLKCIHPKAQLSWATQFQWTVPSSLLLVPNNHIADKLHFRNHFPPFPISLLQIPNI